MIQNTLLLKMYFRSLTLNSSSLPPPPPAVETQLFVQFAVHEGEDHERQQADQQQHGAECHRSYDRCGSHVGEPRRNGEDGENADAGNGHLKSHGQSHLLAFEPLGYGF